MIDPELLLRLLAVALERLPDHELVLDQPTWDAMVAKHGRGGLMFAQDHDDGPRWRVTQADHESELVLRDRTMAAGGTIISTRNVVIGVLPDSDDDDGA